MSNATNQITAKDLSDLVQGFHRPMKIVKLTGQLKADKEREEAFDKWDALAAKVLEEIDKFHEIDLNREVKK